MAEDKEIIVRDLLISYSVRGDIERQNVVILLHGWRSSKEVWADVATALHKAGYTVLALDLPGFGKSDTPKDVYDVELYAGLIKDFMKKLSIAQVSVVGHSFGGRIAIVLSAKYQSLVKKLILVDSAGIREMSGYVRFLGTVAKVFKPLFKPAFMQPLRKRIYQYLGSDDYVATPELRKTFTNTIERDLSDFMPSIASPTLILWGAHDTDTPVADGEKMATLIPHSKLAVLPLAGHFSFLDSPETFNKTLIEFLEA